VTDTTRLYASGALGLALAAGLGFAAARLTQPAAPAPAAPSAEKTDTPTDTIIINAAAIKASDITVAPAASGALQAAYQAPATVEAAPDAEAVLTAHAGGTVTRILRRIGDPVRAGETLALVESRDASAIAAERATASARVALASRQLEREKLLLSQGVSPRADYDTAQANLAVAQADARKASAAASAARLAGDGRSVSVVSPVAGRVTAAPAHLGQFVAAETELFRVADGRALQVTASLPAPDAARVRTGDKAELVAQDGTVIAAAVHAATGVVDPQSRAATIVLAPHSDARGLLPGQLVQARIFASGDAPSHAVTVPQDAVQTLGGKTVVFVRTGNGFRARPVVVASRSGGAVAIASGLVAGTPIATANAFLLKAELEKSQGGDD